MSPRRFAQRLALSRLLAALAIAAVSTCGLGVGVAHAGRYPMYQCDGASDPAIAPGWSINSDSASSLSMVNDCAQGATFGVHGFYNGNPGEQLQTNPNGSTISLNVNVPSSAPDVTITSWSGEVVIPTYSGNEAFIGFHSGGQVLGSSPGLPTLHPGESLNQNYSVALPQGARDFGVSLFCSTSNSQTNCDYSNADQMPGVQNMTFMLSDQVPPTISAVAGSLPTTAARQSVVSGVQTMQFTAADVDSGVASATLILTPATTRTPMSTSFNFGSQCTWSSWNACPTSKNIGSVNVDTGALKDDTYTVTLEAQDAAGNLSSDPLGTITTHNAPAVSSPPTIAGAPTQGQTLIASNGTFSAASSAGAITLSGQWLRCDAQGGNCQPVPGFTGTSYDPAAEDQGHTLRYQDTATDNDGSTVAQSAALGPVGQSAIGTQSLSNGLTGAQPTNGSQGSSSGKEARIANGTPCPGPSINLSINGRSATRALIPFGHSVTVKGRLGCQATPVPEATITVDASGEAKALSLHTDADGTFVYSLPLGPSRTLSFRYTAYSTDSEPAATATAAIEVAPKIALSIAPRYTHNDSTILWRGRITGGPYPPGGVTLLVQVRENDRWQTFDQIVTHDGRIAYRYTFRRTTRPTTYTFRVALPHGGSVGYPYSPAASRPINVRVG